MIWRGAIGALLCLLTVGAATGTGFADPRVATATMAADCAARSGSVQPLAKIVNTRDRSFDCLGLSLDARANIAAIRFEKHDSSVTAAAIHVREFSPAEVATARGAVLDGTPGHDAVVLRGQIGAGATSVPLVVTFLYNGFTGEYRACRATLDRVAGGGWRLMDADDRPVSVVVVKTWGLPVIGTVGIAALQGICAQS
jgi:hypothetical protein